MNWHTKCNIFLQEKILMISLGEIAFRTQNSYFWLILHHPNLKYGRYWSIEYYIDSTQRYSYHYCTTRLEGHRWRKNDGRMKRIQWFRFQHWTHLEDFLICEFGKIVTPEQTMLRSTTEILDLSTEDACWVLNVWYVSKVEVKTSWLVPVWML